MPTAKPGRIRAWPTRWLTALIVVLVVVGVACSSDDADSPAAADDDVDRSDDAADDRSGPTPPDLDGDVPDFDGDPDSPYCRLVADGERQPAADPFASGIDAREFELRLRNVRRRMADFLDVSPPELTDDLASLVDALDEVAAAAEPYDYDLGALAAAGDTIEVLTDPALAVVALRLEIYNLQVCDVTVPGR